MAAMAQDPKENRMDRCPTFHLSCLPVLAPRPPAPPMPIEESKEQISSSASLSTLKIIVGAEKTEFLINKLLICSESEFFSSACQHEANNYAKTTMIILTNCNPKNFGIFMSWILTKSLSVAPGLIELPPVSPSDDGKATTARQESISAKYNQLCECLIDSCTFKCQSFEVMINDALIKFCKDVFSEFDIPEGTSVQKIAEIFKATNHGPLLTLQPEMSRDRAEKWMHDHDGYMMLRDSETVLQRAHDYQYDDVSPCSYEYR
ncbi:hypothetical protein BKA65DRAFT_577051 [Rhexocercosporidium sp. MPI-PUGE-AT-0058]|nr:hypothetical protein BKA65DRAFT_577051 [Rhexocercosporidium sp. MPI-PUGE-AT-0058]